LGRPIRGASSHRHLSSETPGYRSHKKTGGEECTDRIAALSDRRNLRRPARERNYGIAVLFTLCRREIAQVPFADPDLYREITFENTVRTKLTIADLMDRLPARLSAEECDRIDGILAETLSRPIVLGHMR
jgi:hypothetical protein